MKAPHIRVLRSLLALFLLAPLCDCKSSSTKQQESHPSSESSPAQKSRAPVPQYVPTPEEEADLAAVQRKIASDQRIKSKDLTIKIRHDPVKNAITVFELQGTVDTYDELFAVNTDARSSTNIRIAGATGLTVDAVKQRDPWEVGSGRVPPSAPFVEPAEKPQIPICEGETVVTAVAGSGGDYESIKTIESIDPDQIVLKYSAETRDGLVEVPKPRIALTKTRRKILRADLESAHKYVQIFANDQPEDGTGTTAIGVSAEVVRDLRNEGRSNLEICFEAGGGPVASDGKAYFITGIDKKPVFTPAGCTNFHKFEIYRVGDKPEPFKVLLNGKPMDLPAIHVKASYNTHRYELFFLDDEHNPLTLGFRFGIQSVPALKPYERSLCESARTNTPIDCQRNPSIPPVYCGGYFGGFSGADPPSCDLPYGGDRETLRVVKIDTDCRLPNKPNDIAETTGMKELEQSLSKTGNVDVFSIYFSFNSDALRDESEPTLKEIAGVLRKHSDWKLRISGHTDGVGGDQSNLDLSELRAASVKDALVKRYGIDPSRLISSGYGKSQPIDTNDTLEGRAHNRRVELARLN